MDDQGIDGIERAVEGMLSREKIISPDVIREWIRRFRSVPGFEIIDADAELLARRFETRHNVTMNLGAVLTAHDYRPWLEPILADVDFYYWSRYKKLLEEKHFSSKVISTLNQDTERTLGYLENPGKAGPWKRRGMVVGHVQSGKTANYIGLVAKAADVGYRLIVVIAGVHNNLRNQTQKRIDEGFVGRDSARLLSKREERVIGVGRYDSTRRPVTFTNSLKDFNKTMATGVGVPLQNLNEPAVFVIKKHPSTLKNLVEWLAEHNASRGRKTIDTPMLLIDDEADNASINVAYSKDEVAKINSLIRTLLGLFERSSYVGYTATPFANIFIDPDTDDEMLKEDLFPKDFIVSLDPPSNYFGPSRVFGENARQIIRHVSDNEESLPLKHVKAHSLSQLPTSLIEALRTFIVARAVRLHRGQTKEHNSMLVNVSRFTDVQGQVRSLLQEALLGIQADVRLNGGLPVDRALRNPEMTDLHQIWQQEYSGSDAPWDKVQSKLLEASAPIKVVEVNSRSHGTLNYDDYADTGLNVIAVGGLSLSRGLTLEGLTVSYFLRNSMMYDTLMQMGRWFGYRPGYEDLCRLWMPEEAEGWYVHITEAMEMLREEFRRMAAAGATPSEFGLKVRAHPDTLIVTARNKMGAGQRVVVSIGLGNEFVETATLRNDTESLEQNRSSVSALFTTIRAAGVAGMRTPPKGGSWLFGGIPANVVVDFLSGFVNHSLSILTETEPVKRYIRDRADGELQWWDVLVVGVRAEPSVDPDPTTGLQLEYQTRTAGNRSDDSTLRITNKQRVASRGVEKVGLSQDAIDLAEQRYRAQLQGEGPNGTVNYPDRIYRAVRTRPLLIIHLLTVWKPKTTTRMHEKPVVAWSISFPQTNRPEKRVEYVVTRQWLREHMQAEDGEAEDVENDDE
jgi:hypothetical protein